MPPEFAAPLSYGRRLTIRRKRDLANGTHPTTRRALATAEHPGAGHTCGDCAHHFVHYRAGTYHKCEMAAAGLAHGPLSDVRVGWPACTAWEAQ